jgi:3-deoxy-D-manno-octulosonic-acid transferase
MTKSVECNFPKGFQISSLFWIYKLLCILLLPFIFLFFLKKSFKEPSYRYGFLERLGFGEPFNAGSIWIHAVSLGEFRASVPLVANFLKMSERLLITTMTPAGKEEAEKVLRVEILEGRVKVVYLPLELNFAFKLFFRRFEPKFGIILEYELWPVLISSSYSSNVPLVLAQGKYNQKSFIRDKKYLPIRGKLLDGFKLILAKSELHAERFRYFTSTNVRVMGELRFEQSIPNLHLTKAKKFLKSANFENKERAFFVFW